LFFLLFLLLSPLSHYYESCLKDKQMLFIFQELLTVGKFSRGLTRRNYFE
jgi:hypothetical protein